ncbi:GNAT family N-acetyltransferase, partial [Halobium palmae]
MHVRLATTEDAAAVRDIYAPAVEESAISFEDEPPSSGEIRSRIARKLPTFPWLVCERVGSDENAEGAENAPDEAGSDSVVGYAYAGPYRSREAYRWSVEVSVYVADDARRTGVGRTLYESLLALLAEQGFVTAYAAITLPNEASVGLHESLGFERIGVFEDVGYKRGAWRDVGFWEKRLRDPPDEPTPPMGVETVRV